MLYYVFILLKRSKKEKIMKKVVKLAAILISMLLAAGCAPYQAAPNSIQAQPEQPQVKRATPVSKRPITRPRPAAPNNDLISVKVDTKESVTEIRGQNRVEKDYVVNYGMNKIEIVGPVFQKINRGCSEVELFKYAVDAYPGKRVDNIVHIRMEQNDWTAEIKTSPTTFPVTKKAVTCKAAALAISYVSVPLPDAARYFPAMDSLENFKGITNVDKNEVDERSTIVKGSTFPEVYGEVNRKTGFDIQ